MRFNPKARIDTGGIRDAGQGSGVGGGLGGSPMQIPLPSSIKAGGGITGIIITILFIVLSSCLNGGLSTSGLGTGGAMAPPVSDAASNGRYDQCVTGEDANNNTDCSRVAVLNSLQDFWSAALPQQANVAFRPASMVTFAGSTGTGCGTGQSAMGPFYCPADDTIYEDTSFFEQVLERQLNGPSGQFVEPYVLAHEYGHHIQNLLGTMGQVRTQKGADSDAVRLELQADCYAGIWVKEATTAVGSDGVAMIEGISDEDISIAQQAAQSVGDDRIQQQMGGAVQESEFTHGSAAQRMNWFNIGREQGTLQACDTFSAGRL